MPWATVRFQTGSEAQRRRLYETVIMRPPAAMKTRIAWNEGEPDVLAMAGRRLALAGF
jgi:hypothetical protein